MLFTVVSVNKSRKPLIAESYVILPLWFMYFNNECHTVFFSSSEFHISSKPHVSKNLSKSSLDVIAVDEVKNALIFGLNSLNMSLSLSLSLSSCSIIESLFDIIMMLYYILI